MSQLVQQRATDFESGIFYSKSQEGKKVYHEVTFTTIPDQQEDTTLTMVYFQNVTSLIESAEYSKEVAVKEE